MRTFQRTICEQGWFSVEQGKNYVFSRTYSGAIFYPFNASIFIEKNLRLSFHSWRGSRIWALHLRESRWWGMGSLARYTPRAGAMIKMISAQIEQKSDIFELKLKLSSWAAIADHSASNSSTYSRHTDRLLLCLSCSSIIMQKIVRKDCPGIRLRFKLTGQVHTLWIVHETSVSGLLTEPLFLCR